MPQRTWNDGPLPVATRTAWAGRFTIEGETGFWRMPSHMNKELLHDGPERGSVVARLCRYHSKIPTAVAFVRKRVRGLKSVTPEDCVGRQPSRDRHRRASRKINKV